MFTNLLGASMNCEVIDEHPAFVEIIKQLTSDECKMLKALYKNNILPMMKLRIKLDKEEGEGDVTPYFSDLCYVVGCHYPQKFPEYLDNLHRLGLVEVDYDRYLTNNQYYEKLKEHKAFVNVVSTETSTIIEKKSIYKLSEMGKKFCSICLE